MLLPGAGQAASRTQTLRFFDKPVSTKLTHPDGTVVANPRSQPQPGDILDVDSLDYRGNHARHSKQFTGSTHLRCTFAAGGPPTCESHVAIGNSLLVFTGNPGTLTNGTGIYQGATGRVVSSKEVRGVDNASDVVAKIHLRG
jgi:hypothetical protein